MGICHDIFQSICALGFKIDSIYKHKLGSACENFLDFELHGKKIFEGFAVTKILTEKGEKK